MRQPRGGTLLTTKSPSGNSSATVMGVSHTLTTFSIARRPCELRPHTTIFPLAVAVPTR